MLPEKSTTILEGIKGILRRLPLSVYQLGVAFFDGLFFQTLDDDLGGFNLAVVKYTSPVKEPLRGRHRGLRKNRE